MNRKTFLIPLMLTFVASSAFAFGKNLPLPANNGQPIFGYNALCDANDCKDESGKSILDDYTPRTGKIVKLHGDCLLTDKGEVSCKKSSNVLPPNNLGSVVDIAGSGVKQSFCALKTNGNISCWPFYNSAENNQEVASFSKELNKGLKGSVRIFGGYEYFCGLLVDSSVKCFFNDTGFSKYTNYTSPIPGLKARDLYLGYDFGCAVTLDGKVQCWADNDNRTPRTTEFSGVSKIDGQVTGIWNALCAMTDKGVQCQGSDAKLSGVRYLFQTLELMIKYTNPVSVAFGYSNGFLGVIDDACLLLRDGSMKCLKSYNLMMDPAPAEYPILDKQSVASCPTINGTYSYDNGWSTADLKFDTTGPGKYHFHYLNHYSRNYYDYQISADGNANVSEMSGETAYCKNGVLFIRLRGLIGAAMSGRATEIEETSFRPDGKENLIVGDKTFDLLAEKETRNQQDVLALNEAQPATAPIPPAFLEVGAQPAVMANMGNYIYVIGAPKNAGAIPELVVARINQNGQLDQSFGTQGAVKLAFGSNSAFKVKPYAITANGNNLIVAGELGVWNQGNLLLAEIRSDGSFEPSFVNAGWGTYTLGDNPPTTQAQSIAIDSSGEIEVKGKISNRTFDDFSNFTAHFDKTGKLIGQAPYDAACLSRCHSPVKSN